MKSRKEFDFSSHKLDYQQHQLNVRGKIPTEFQLWKDCKKGDKEALGLMDTYCRQDVLSLEDFYFEIRPWIKSHPNMGIFVDTDNPVCPTCGSTKLDWGGSYNTMVSQFTAFRCKDCKAIGRCRQTSIPKSKRKHLTASVAR